jgi:hypothetical protein
MGRRVEPYRAARFGRRQVVSRAEPFHLAGDAAPQRRSVEGLDRRDSALPFREGTEELLAPEPD